jgi:CubicO group peptidase (beta-lactamase class C family)
MTRHFLIILLTFACCYNALGQAHYYGRIKTQENTIPLYLYVKNNREGKLTILSFRGYEVPLKTFRIKKDSLIFRRKDGNAVFKGHYDKTKSGYAGMWNEDGSSHEVLFIPARPDTIKRLNPRTTSAYLYNAPPKFDDGLELGDCASANVDEQKLSALVQKIIRKKYDYIHSVLIARNNQLVLEEYFYEFPREAHFGIQSATKSFVSALTGIALDRGEIPALTTSVCNYLTDHRELACNPQNKTIALHDLLSMSTGLQWDEVTYDYGHEKNSSVIAADTGDELRYLLTRPRASKELFAYNSLNHIMMNHVLKRATGLDNSTEMNERLLEPLGISSFDLGEAKDGVIGDIFLRPRDMMKFGLLYLNEGKWRGQQVVPKSWVKESTTSKISVDKNLGYGYFWWTTAFSWNGKKLPAYFAWGYGGQYIFVVPSLQLVTVFTGTNWTTDPEYFYLNIMQTFVVGACKH